MHKRKVMPSHYIAYERDSKNGYIASAPALPGCAAYGKTLQEAYRNIQVAIQECLEVISEFKKKLPFFISIMLLFVVSLLSSASAKARTIRTRGYYKPSTGSYVMPHYKTSPNSSRFDNFSTKGNYNPYTSKQGTVDPFKR